MKEGGEQVEEHVREEYGPLQVFLMCLINVVLFCTHSVPCAIPGTENSPLSKRIQLLPTPAYCQLVKC